MNKDQIQGRMKKAGGKIKEITGKAVGNDKLDAKGQIEQASGKAQANYGDLKHDVAKILKQDD